MSMGINVRAGCGVSNRQDVDLRRKSSAQNPSYHPSLSAGLVAVREKKLHMCI